eukprot:scaffold142396_cov21-Tisochrysis_lutea.AAC.1
MLSPARVALDNTSVATPVPPSLSSPSHPVSRPPPLHYLDLAKGLGCWGAGVAGASGVLRPFVVHLSASSCAARRPALCCFGLLRFKAAC